MSRTRVKAWLDREPSPQPGSGRIPFEFRLSSRPNIPDRTTFPRSRIESGGLFELSFPRSRVAMKLGIAAREPSSHVFVSARRSDDRRRRRSLRRGFSRGRETPARHRYVTTSDNHEARSRSLTRGSRGKLVARDGCDDRREEWIPSIACATKKCGRATQKLARDLESKSRCRVKASPWMVLGYYGASARRFSDIRLRRLRVEMKRASRAASAQSFARLDRYDLSRPDDRPQSGHSRGRADR